MPALITLKLDATLIDKARLFVGKEKNGHTPKYLDLVLVPRKTVGKFGATHIVKQSVSKEERENGVEMPIIGEATERGGNAPAPRQAPPPAQDSDDVNF